MRAIFLIGILAVSSIILQAQTAEQDVNRDVWFPFVEAYNNMDGQAFMSVHTTDIVRVNRNGKNIRAGKDYARDMIDYFEREKQSTVRHEIELRFLERFYGDETGFEVGIYRVRRTTGGQEQLFYGKFHVLLRKENGFWKIAMDSDSSNNGTIREEDFVGATPLPER